MAIGRKRRRGSDLPGWLLALIIVIVLGLTKQWLYFTLALVVCVLAGWIWFLLLRPTTCDVRNVTNGRPCSKNAKGYLRACSLQRHKQIKASALAQRLRLRRTRRPQVWGEPTAALSVSSHSGRPPTRTTGAADEPLCRNSYEVVSLACALTSTLAGIVGTVVAIMTFAKG